MEQATLDHLGSCKKCTVSKDDTIVLDGGGDRSEVEARCETIRDLIAASKARRAMDDDVPLHEAQEAATKKDD